MTRQQIQVTGSHLLKSSTEAFVFCLPDAVDGGRRCTILQHTTLQNTIPQHAATLLNTTLQDTTPQNTTHHQTTSTTTPTAVALQQHGSQQAECHQAAVHVGFDQHFYESPDTLPLEKISASSNAGYTIHESVTKAHIFSNSSPFAATSYLKSTDDLDENYIKSDDMSNTFHLVPQAAVEIEMHEACDSQDDNYECITLLDMDEANEKSKTINRRPTSIKSEFPLQSNFPGEKTQHDRPLSQTTINPISLERSELKVVDEHYVLCPSQGAQIDPDFKKTIGDRKTCPICFKTITSKNYARHRRTHPGVQGNFGSRGASQYWVNEATNAAFNTDP